MGMISVMPKTAYFQSHQRGIEIVQVLVLLLQITFFQSHQRGIEIILSGGIDWEQKELPIAPKRN